MVAIIMPLFSMEKERVIYIMGDVSIIPLKESNVVLMKALYKHSQLHQGVINQRGLIPRYEHVSQDALCLVNEALTVRPDQFKDLYNYLPVDARISLIKSSGQYDDKGKKVMLDVPEVTKRLIEVCFTDNDLRNHIKSYLKNEDEDYVRNYFKEQLICSKRLLTLKQSVGLLVDKPISDMLREDIYLGSVFLNGIHTIRLYDHPISLRTGDKVRQTYATSFGIDNYEYRITDVRDNQCLLWVINHDNPDAIFSTLIKHKGNIKGCCLSSTQTDVEGALTFSDHDMVFSTITTLNGVSFINSVSVESPHQIVDISFEPIKSNWRVASYEGLETVFRRWSMEGSECTKNVGVSPFKQYGLLNKIATCKTTSGYRVVEIFNVADLYSVGISDVANDDGVYWIRNRTPLQSLHTINGHYCSKLFRAGNSIAMYNFDYPFFGEKEEADFWSQPDSPVHRTYSPNGSFLMCNSLKKKWVMLYVETVIQDAMTHKQILSIDTLYNGFAGVGFTHDETELIFLDHMGGNQKVSLLNDKDKQKLFQIEDVACTNLGVASTVKRLCMECREKGTVTLHEDDPNRKMLIDWSRKFPELLQLLTKCLPITKIKK
jgi:hypothetical protein